MLSKYAIGFGITLLVVGVLGFIPAATPEGRLFGIFAVDGVHNMVHLASGIIGIIAGIASQHAARQYFQIFGVVYGLVLLMGLFVGDGQVLGVMAHNWADVGLHLIVSGIALYLGFSSRQHQIELAHR